MAKLGVFKQPASSTQETVKRALENETTGRSSSHNDDDDLLSLCFSFLRRLPTIAFPEKWEQIHMQRQEVYCVVPIPDYCHKVLPAQFRRIFLCLFN